jgi:molecular chaperone HtpG
MSIVDSVTIELRAAQVDMAGLLTVLGDHLYSTPLVAVRELLQNAHDSIVRRRIEDPAWAPAANDGAGPAGGRIVVRASPGLLSIEDDGAGLTDEEIVAYLATIGAGYTRNLRQSTGSEELIGLFGLGFLSAFVVSDRVRVTTTSYKSPDRGFLYQSRAGARYTIEPVPPRPVGTVVELQLKDKLAALGDPEAVRRVLRKYACLLRVPVFVGDDRTPVNDAPPPWRAPTDHAVRARRDRLAFASRFETTFEPICTMDVAPRGGSDARGILWVQDGATYGTSDHRRLFVFVRGMLLDDDARDLLPTWAGFIGGVVESARLTPTASREDLQRDDAFRATAEAIAEAVIEGLVGVASREPEAWRRVLSRHNEALLGAALCDDRLFSLLADSLTVPTSEGDLPARTLVTENRRIYLAESDRGGFEEMLFRALRVPVAAGKRYAVAPFLRRWAERAGAAVVALGTEEGNRMVFRPAELPPADIEFLRAALAEPGHIVVPARFSPAEVPLVLVPDREAELKRRIASDEADKRISQAVLSLARMWQPKAGSQHTAHLYVNLDAPVIEKLLAAKKRGADTAAAAALLRALVAMVSGAGAPDVDLRRRLADYGAVVASLLDRALD